MQTLTKMATVFDKLTFGFHDSIALGSSMQEPILMAAKVSERDGKNFASLLDGGSSLNPDNAQGHFIIRSSILAGSKSGNKDAPFIAGAIFRLLNYNYRSIIGKREKILVVSNYEVIDYYQENIAQIIQSQYPFDVAAEQLASMQHNQQNHPPPERERQYSDPQRAADTSIVAGGLNPSYHTGQPPLSGADNSAVADGAISTGYNPIRKGSVTGLQGVPAVQRSAPYAPQYRQAGPVARRVDGQFIEIKNLTSFLGRWVVKGRFINKGEPRTYSNQRGEGKLWNCELVDSLDKAGTIRCTFFNKAVDKFFPLINANEIYTVSRGTLKPANRKFNSGSHEFELQLGEDALIQWVATDDPTVPLKPTTERIRIADLSNMAKFTVVTVCGVLVHMSPITEIVTRSTGQPRSRREITIADDSNTTIDVTLWGSKASSVPDDLAVALENNTHPTILIENVRVDEYNGRKLSSVGNTDVQIEPNIPEAKAISRWFAGEGRQKLGQLASLTNASWGGEGRTTDHVTVAELKRLALQRPERELEDRGSWFSCTATLVNIDKERQFFWVACPTCGKKVATPAQTNDFGETEQSRQFNDGGHEVSFCTNCSKEVENPTRKYLLNLEIADATGNLKSTVLGDKGLLIMGGISADTLVEVQNKGCDPSLYQRYDDYFLQRLRREYVFKIQAKSETYRDETRVRYRVFSADPVNAVVSSDSVNGPNGISVCRNNIIKEANRTLEKIYNLIPRVSSV